MRTPAAVATTMMLAAALFARPAAASNSEIPSRHAVVQPAVATSPDVRTARATSEDQQPASTASYADLMQRIRQDSLRELTEKLDTSDLIAEIISATMNNVVEAALGAKPQL